MKEHAVGQGTKPWIRLDSKRKILIQGTVCKEKKLHADLGHRLFQQYSVKPGTHGLGTPKLKQMDVHETGSTHFLFSAPVGAMADNLADALIRFATKRAGVFVNILCPQNQEKCRCCPWPQALAPQLSND
jgi:hypothetical protein